MKRDSPSLISEVIYLRSKRRPRRCSPHWLIAAFPARSRPRTPPGTAADHLGATTVPPAPLPPFPCSAVLGAIRGARSLLCPRRPKRRRRGRRLSIWGRPQRRPRPDRVLNKRRKSQAYESLKSNLSKCVTSCKLCRLNRCKTPGNMTIAIILHKKLRPSS